MDVDSLDAYGPDGEQLAANFARLAQSFSEFQVAAAKGMAALSEGLATVAAELKLVKAAQDGGVPPVLFGKTLVADVTFRADAEGKA